MRHVSPRPSVRPWLAACLAGLFLLTVVVSGYSPTPTSAAPPHQTFPDWRTYANGDDVWGLAFEGDSIVWAATRGGGVVRWDVSDVNDPKPTQYLFPQSGLAGNIVRDVVVGPYGNKWFATERGLSELTVNGTWRTFTVDSTGGKLPSNVVTALAVQGTNLWVGTQQVFNQTSKKWEGGGIVRVDVSFDPPTFNETWNADSNSDVMSSNNITDIAVDPTNGDVWVTSRVDEKNVEPTADRPNRYFEVRDGGITVVHTQGGFALEKFQRGSATASWPKYQSILSAAVDGTGVKWFGSGDLDGGGNGFYALGGNSYSNAKWKWFGSDNTISGQTIVSNMPVRANQIPHIAISPDNKIWVSMANNDVAQGEGMGVCRITWDRNFDANNAPLCEVAYDTTQSGGQRLPGNLVRALRFRSDDRLRVFGTAGRLAAKGSADFSQGSDGHGVAMQVIDNNNTATIKRLVTGGQGVADGSRGIAPSSNHISALTFDGSGNLWVGYAYPLATGSEAWRGRGVDYLSSTDGIWRHSAYSTDGTTSLAVGALAYDPSTQRIWVGLLKEQLANSAVVSGGAAYRTAQGNWTVFREDTGAPSASVTSLAIDGPIIWAGTGSKWPSVHGSVTISKGVGRFDNGANNWVSSIRQPTLFADEVNDLTVGAGQVWVANTSPQSPGVDNPPGGINIFSNGSPVRSWPANQANLTLTNNDPRAVYYASDGTAWVGGYYSLVSEDPVVADAVINWLPPGTETWERRNFADDGWVSAIIARTITTPAIWIGTTRGGQNIEDFPAKVFPPNGGNTYLATGGLKIFANGAWRELTRANSPLTSDHITSLALDSANNLWIGTTLGMMYYKGDIDGNVIVPPTPIASSTPAPTALPTSTPVVPPTITPFAGERAAETFTPVVATVTPTPFPGSPPPEIPEASTVWLLGSGLAGLAGYLRFFVRRRK